MKNAKEKPASIGHIDEEDPNDFQFPRGGSGRKKLPDVEPVAETGSRRRKRSKRTQQFTTKADPDLLTAFYSVLDEIEVSTTLGFEMALKEFVENRSI